jgi:hypothetical protein
MTRASFGHGTGIAALAVPTFEAFALIYLCMRRMRRIALVTRMDQQSEHPREESDLQGQYANYYRVGFNAFEFVVDFGQVYEGQAHPQLHTRIVTSPVYAKELLRILSSSVQDFERTYRIIGDEDV